MQELYKILENLGYFGLASAALAWLLKALFGHLMKKDLSQYKQLMDKATLEHKVAFEHLHERRANVLMDYYSEISRVRIIIRAFRISSDEEYSDNEKKLLKAALIGSQKAYNLLTTNEIFFPKRLQELATDLSVKMFHYAGRTDATLNFILNSNPDIDPEKISFVATNLKKGFQEAEDTITPLLDEIRNEFQILLGIEDRKPNKPTK